MYITGMPSFHTYKSSQSQHAVFKITEHFIKNDIKSLNQILVFVDQKSSLQYLKKFNNITKICTLRHAISTQIRLNCNGCEII